MSSTNRHGVEREENDKYYTPEWLVEGLMREFNKERILNKPIRVLEPAVGGGAIIKVMQKHFLDMDVVSWDIAPDEDYPCEHRDFLSVDPIPEFDIIITNPPYRKAQEFVEHSLKFRKDENSLVIMLLRTAFLGGQERSIWLRQYMPERLYVSPRRPNFRGKGTDSTEYGWFVWSEPAKYTKVYFMDTYSERFENKYRESLSEG